MSCPNPYREMYLRLHSAHGVRYAAEIAALNARYSLEPDRPPLPTDYEINDYHDFGHLWGAEALADFVPRYKEYLRVEGLRVPVSGPLYPELLPL